MQYGSLGEGLKVKVLEEQGYALALRGMAYSYKDRTADPEVWWDEGALTTAPATRCLTNPATTSPRSRCTAALSCSMRSRWHMLKRANVAIEGR